MDVTPTPATEYRLFTIDHVAKLVFETITALGFLPALWVVAGRGRHFECFIGLFQLLTAVMFNLCDSLDSSLVLKEREWHEMTNVLTITYGLFLVIYLMGNHNESRDHILRYSAFASVWIAQVHDGYWMDQSYATVYVCVGYVVLCVVKVAFVGGAGIVVKEVFAKGVAMLGVAALLFVLSLRDQLDRFRLLHGLAQVTVGVALYYLWQAIPPNNYKKTDVLPIALPLFKM